MIIDVLFLLALLGAVIQGFRNGLIIAVFSLVGWIAGLYAALKFSGTVADYFQGSVNLSPKWMSVLAFAAVFLIVMLLVRMGAMLIQKTVELALLGWANRLGGIFFYVFLYTFIFSVLLSFAERVRLLSEETISSSRVYPIIKPAAHIIQLPFLR
jgi:membrane protein required for colicin V production